MNWHTTTLLLAQPQLTSACNIKCVFFVLTESRCSTTCLPHSETFHKPIQSQPEMNMHCMGWKFMRLKSGHDRGQSRWLGGQNTRGSKLDMSMARGECTNTLTTVTCDQSRTYIGEKLRKRYSDSVLVAQKSKEYPSSDTSWIHSGSGRTPELRYFMNPFLFSKMSLMKRFIIFAFCFEKCWRQASLYANLKRAYALSSSFSFLSLGSATE